jgi:predicted small lipoprotein YifL
LYSLDGIEAAVARLGGYAAWDGCRCHKHHRGGHLMASFRKLTIPIVAAILLLGGLTACDRKGPMERAGEKVDRSVERAGDKVERATDK